MRKNVRSMTRPQLRKELFGLRSEFAQARKEIDEDGGAAGSPCEWMDERADEIRTELRSRARWR